jgi:hypothetical protein
MNERTSTAKAHVAMLDPEVHVSTIPVSRVMLLVGLSLRVRMSRRTTRYLRECRTGAFFGGKISAAQPAGFFTHASVANFLKH